MTAKLSILLVDDDREVLGALSAMLSHQGVSVTTASSASEALTVFKKHGFDVVLSDLEMPGGNGDSLARQIKKIAPMIPVIVVTGSPRSRVSPLMFDGYVQKGEPDKIMPAINYAMSYPGKIDEAWLAESLRATLDRLRRGADKPGEIIDDEFSSMVAESIVAVRVGDSSAVKGLCEAIVRAISGSESEDFPELRHDQRLALRLHVLRLVMLKSGVAEEE
jgi:CheY-like chemotaxis protein